MSQNINRDSTTGQAAVPLDIEVWTLFLMVFLLVLTIYEVLQAHCHQNDEPKGTPSL